jgi:hypothetical protein
MFASPQSVCFNDVLSGSFLMTVARFVESLFTGGRVRVGESVDRNAQLRHPTSEDLQEAESILKDLESSYRADLPDNPPAISDKAMIWGAVTTYYTSSFLAYRDAGEEAIRLALSVPCPEAPSPSVCYSVDLTLRFLPDLVRLARAVSANDPLVDILTSLARQWPLSSVGIADVEPVDVTSFVDNNCLLQLYTDRIIATKDRSRLKEQIVRDKIRSAIGLHSELAPELSKCLDSTITPPGIE